MGLSSRDTDTTFKAIITQNQFRAIAEKINLGEIVEHLRTRHLDRRTLADSELKKIFILLTNGWNSEYCIRSLVNDISGENVVNHIQWLFPQMYYSISTVYQAYLITVDQSVEDHTALLNNYSRFLTSRGISCIGYSAEGPIRNIVHTSLLASKPSNVLAYTGEIKDVDGHVASFLKSTHEDRLKDLALSMKNRLKIERLNKELHQKIGKSAHATTLVHLLYRKRIKSNYRDIDTYFDPALDSKRLFNDVLIVVRALNWLVEGYIQKKLGPKVYYDLIGKLPSNLERIPSGRKL